MAKDLKMRSFAIFQLPMRFFWALWAKSVRRDGFGDILRPWRGWFGNFLEENYLPRLSRAAGS